MAHIVPSDISRLALSGGNSKELDTLQQLKTQLPNDYTVFHGVHWSREYDARNAVRRDRLRGPQSRRQSVIYRAEERRAAGDRFEPCQAL